MSQLPSELSKLSVQMGQIEAKLREALPQTSRIINNPELNFQPVVRELFSRVVNELDLLGEIKEGANITENYVKIQSDKSKN